MPKVIKVEDPKRRSEPLRVTARKGRQWSPTRRSSPSIRVRCGCCAEAIVIHHEDPGDSPGAIRTLEIGGVFGTVEQWRKVLGPMLKDGVPKLG